VVHSHARGFMDCLFCKIAEHEAEADIIAENEHAVAFRDINPKAPVHILVIPKEHRASLPDATDDDQDMLGNLLLFVREVAEQLGLSSAGYKVLMNVGRGGGQIIDHIHFHLLGGWKEKPGTVNVRGAEV